jgi:predicted membrane-bound mannosyltransferase
MSIAELPPQIGTPGHAALFADTPRRTFTLEQVLYVGLFLLSLLVHLWGLDNRALHHDETLHAAFSYYVFSGRGYVHDPLLHGPFLYFWGAFIYFLFGDTNYTARLSAALFGSVLTVLPYLMRREMGRGTALIASLALLVSPVILYVGRFIRHDIYAVVFEVIVFISVVRYASTRQARWLYLGAGALALMFTTLETFFLYVAMFLPVVLGLFFYRVWRPGAALVVALGITVAALVFVLPGYPERPFPSSDTVNRLNGPYVCPSAGNLYPADSPMQIARPGPLFGLPPLATFDNEYALCVRHQPDNDLGAYLVKLGQFFGHPAIIASFLITALTLGALYWLIWRRPDREGITPWLRARITGDATLEAFANLSYGRRWLIALAIFFSIYALIFSAFLTNPVGIISGTTGSLLYWLAQHEVERGGQPRHFYLVMLSIYEPLMLFWSVIGFGLLARMGWQRLRVPQPETSERATTIDWTFALPALLGWWLLAALFVYSWAGEKMPWLTIHIATPLTLFGSWSLMRVFSWWRRPDPNAPIPPTSERTALATYLGVFAAIAILCFLLIAIAIRTAGAQLAYVPFFPLIGIALVLLLTIGTAVLMGRRWAVGALAVAITLLGTGYAARSAFQLSFRWGDTPREMMIYTQTSPDVMRAIERLEQAARRRGGALDMPIWYDNETVWDWYMRRFTRAQEQPAGVIPIPPDEVQALLILEENLNDQNRMSFAGFRVQRFPLRWWFPEDAIYRLPDDWQTREVTADSPLLMRMLRTPLDGTTAAQYWDYMFFRNLHAPLGSSDFVLVVRPGIADEIGLGTGEQR